MNKQELQKKYQEIVLKTNNVSADDKILNFVHRWKKERLNKLKVE